MTLTTSVDEIIQIFFDEESCDKVYPAALSSKRFERLKFEIIHKHMNSSLNTDTIGEDYKKCKELINNWYVTEKQRLSEIDEKVDLFINETLPELSKTKVCNFDFDNKLKELEELLTYQTNMRIQITMSKV